MKKIKIFYSSVVSFVWAIAASAQTTDNGLSGAPGINLTIQSVFGIITGLACWFTRFALIAIVIAIIVYGIQFMTSQGNPGKFDQAKKSFKYGIIGVIVILGAYTIIATIANAINPSANYTPFIPLNCSAY